MTGMLEERDYIVKVKKFVLDDEVQKAEYLEILNNPECVRIDEKFTYDKLKNNTPITTLWWREPRK
jgi:hypothetical protein